ncbi:membrane protein insertion efficiency factor YidD [Nitratifractor sp.]|uniref:membrane protein insertion efficiency factor YidD n=1 Tax=Nitratifractor sp. TaxID=2268144 RepID=UPI0025E4A601|nr:membrane protein insertion efficiency factor YidD [Nitratifractor sp.]
MKIKRFFIAPIRGYQYLSQMLPASCRYYPTCSEYAKWQFEFNRPDRAFAATALRILRCNQLFPGGIDYPRVRWEPPAPAWAANPLFPPGRILAPLPRTNPSDREIAIQYWIVPLGSGKYLILKAFDD